MTDDEKEQMVHDIGWEIVKLLRKFDLNMTREEALTCQTNCFMRIFCHFTAVNIKKESQKDFLKEFFISIFERLNDVNYLKFVDAFINELNKD